MTYDLPPDALDRDLVFDFFWRFSTFECALKREGFLRVGSDDAAQADWSRFGREIRSGFRDPDSPELSAALRFLESRPPRMQVVRNGVLGWDDLRPSHGSREAYALLLIRVIRNNLFHGGKYPDGPVKSLERDRDLLAAASVVLEACYDLHPGMARRRNAA